MNRLLTTAFLFFSMCQVWGQSAQSKFREAQQAYESGNYYDAFSRLNETELMLGGTNAKIQSLKVELYYAQGDVENAAIEAAKYFKVVPYSMQGTEGYNAMLDMQKELKAAIENKFNMKKKELENEKKNELAAMDNALGSEEENYYYNLVKNCDYPQAISDFINKYPGSSYRSSLEQRKNKLNNDIDQKENPGKYLTDALKARDQAKIDKLLSFGCNANVTDASGKPALNIAAENNDIANVKKLYNAGAEIDATDQNDRTALSVAVENENTEIIDYLINVGANVNKTDDNYESPLFYAIRANSLDLVQSLITYGAVLTGKNRSGNTPLVTAILQNNIDPEIIMNLLHIGVQVNNKVNYNTPLYYAVKNNKTHLAQLLLQYDANPSIKSGDGMTMLHIAAVNRNPDLIRILLEGKADPMQVSDNGFTPLLYAAWDKQHTIADILLKKGAKIDQQGPHGWTSLHYAARERSEEMVKLLLTYSPNKKIEDEWGRTAKKVAKEYHFKNIKKLL